MSRSIDHEHIVSRTLGANLISVHLEPGGYLQWSDLSIIDITSNVQPPPERWMEIHKSHISSAIASGYAPSLPSKVESLCREYGLEGVQRTEYSTVLEGNLALSHEWERKGMQVIIPATLRLRQGLDEVQAKEKSESILQELEDFRQQGVALNMPFITLIGRKKL